MSVASLTIQPIVRTGLAVSYTALTADGAEFVNTEGTFLIAKNTAGTAATVTIATPNTYSGLALADLTVSIPAGSEKLIGSFPSRDFNNSSGKVTVTTDTITTTSVAAVRIS